MKPQDIQSISIEATAGFLLLHPPTTEKSVQNKLCQMIAMGQERDPDLAEVRSIPISVTIAERVEQWMRFLVAEVIHHWRIYPSSEIECQQLLQDLITSESEVSSPLLVTLNQAGLQKPLQQSLQDYFQDLHTQQQQQKLTGTDLIDWLEFKLSQLEYRFVGNQDATGNRVVFDGEGFLTQLSAHHLSLMTKYLQSLTMLLVQIQRLGPQSALRQLRVLTQTLQNTRDQYAQQHQDQLRRGQSAQKAYKNLLVKMAERRWGMREATRLWESALRAANLSYTARLDAEVFRLAEQLLEDLLQPIQYLTLSLAQTDLFLIGVQQFAGEASPTLPTLLQGVLLDRLSPDPLLRQLEAAVGYPIQQWAQIKTLTITTVQQELLQLLRPICFNVYVDCYLATLAIPETTLLPSLAPLRRR